LIQSQTPSGFAFCGAVLVTDVAGAVGPVGLFEHAPSTDATHTSMTKRIVRDIMGSISLEHHRYHMHRELSDIAGGTVIRGGTR
jgi:hypothetical protein